MIRSGTYLGECFTHCNETVTVTPEKTSYALTSNVPDPQNQDVTGETSTSPEEWKNLAKLIDWEKFRALPSTIGEPDRGDAGGEWIEISIGGATKRVDFEMRASVPEIDALVNYLRELRQQLSQQYRR